MKPLRRRLVLSAGAALTLPLLFGRCRSEKRGTPLRRDPTGMLDVPEGFVVHVLQRAGDQMSDGWRTPDRPDGMGCFPGAAPDTLVLMRNHELTTSGGAYAPGDAPPEAYDPQAVGGVSRVVLRADTLEVISSNLVLAGSRRNCAGGASPWGWLTCEEDVTSGHGYVFLCDPLAESLRPPTRIPRFGRMNHEAALIDPASGFAYLTEDRDDSAFYRFVPEAPQQPPGESTQGQLQALCVAGTPARDLNVDVAPGLRLPVEWVTLETPDSPDDSLRAQARDLGAAVVRRGEGLFLHEGAVYFTATSGGPRGSGQVWRYHPDAEALELIAQSVDPAQLDMPDNLCVAPWGDVVLAEDGGWPDQFLRVLTPDGRLLDLARNAVSSSEIAGVCFSPSGDTLFCNLQGDGLTLAIRGPFREFTAREG